MSAADLDSVYVCGGLTMETIMTLVFHGSSANGDVSNLKVCIICPRPVIVQLLLLRHKLYLFGGRSRRFPRKSNDLWVDPIAAEWVRSVVTAHRTVMMVVQIF